jgi:uncharacterized protein (TIGR02145 family)
MSSSFSKFPGAVLLMLGLIGITSCTLNQGNEGKLEDVDGNRYDLVKIGEQVWMAENLKVTHLKDGTPIDMVENYDEWASLSLPAYCWYNNDSLNRDTYGALYNSYVIETGMLCPEGWHVSTDEDWTELETFYGGATVSGGSLKAAGTEFWKAPNTGAVNADGFSALPGGYRNYAGPFNLVRITGFWWTSSERSWYGSDPKLLYRSVKYNEESVVRDIAVKTNGLSVRCVKDRVPNSAD